MNNTRIHKQNRKGDLYLDGGNYTDGRIIFIPQNWCDSFTDSNPDDTQYPDIYGWIGGKDVLNFQNRDSHEYRCDESQGWTPVTKLLEMRQLDEAEARMLDHDLFTLLDAVRSGDAK